jgi:hypothetical protein
MLCPIDTWISAQSPTVKIGGGGMCPPGRYAYGYIYSKRVIRVLYFMWDKWVWSASNRLKVFTGASSISRVERRTCLNVSNLVCHPIWQRGRKKNIRDYINLAAIYNEVVSLGTAFGGG